MRLCSLVFFNLRNEESTAKSVGIYRALVVSTGVSFFDYIIYIASFHAQQSASIFNLIFTITKYKQLFSIPTSCVKSTDLYSAVVVFSMISVSY